MGKSKKQQKTDRFSLFSIGAKLVIIISFLVLISLGSITALVSWLVREDLRVAAEENNFETNRRSSMEAEVILAKMRSDSLILIRTLVAVGTQSALARDTADYFFEQNPRIAALFFSIAGQADELLVNERFFFSREIDPSLADSYREMRQAAMRRAALGDTVILNAAPHFNTPILAMFFPGRAGGGAVLFSSENLNDSFGFGINQSYMINDSGDVLVHADFELVLAGINVTDRAFIRDILESPDRSKQGLIDTDFGFDRSGSIAETHTPQGFIMEKLFELNRIIQPWRETLVLNIKWLIDTCVNAVNDFLSWSLSFLSFERNYERNVYKNVDVHEKVRQFVAYTKLDMGGCTVITSVEYNKVFEGIAATTRRNLYLTAAVLFISIVLIWFFAKSISIPLKALAAAAHAIENGTFELTLKPRGRDEIGILTSSFQKMCAALGIFGRFTNRDIAVRAMRGEIRPGGLTKHATVFFSDIRGFTEKSEDFTKVFGDDASDRIVHWLNNYLTRMVECVEKTGGAVDKFIGDAVMAHWGTVYTAGSPQKDAYNCVFAALMMRKAVYQINKKSRPGDPGNPPISIGCGINTGIVTAGQIGSELRMEYTVIGDPVNLASRIEALNKPLGTDILISESTWNFVKNYFVTEEMPSVTVKGKERPVRIFAVVTIAGAAGGPQTLAEVRELLGIKPPDMAKVDINADELKYKIDETMEYT